jgi:hypothetical protein
MFRRLFTEHPHSVNETYFEHLLMACSFSYRLVGAGFACLVHALFPFLFVKTGSRMIDVLHDEMVRNRVRNTALGQVRELRR